MTAPISPVKIRIRTQISLFSIGLEAAWINIIIQKIDKAKHKIRNTKNIAKPNPKNPANPFPISPHGTLCPFMVQFDSAKALPPKAMKLNNVSANICFFILFI